MLLVAGGGAGFTPAPETFALTASGQGGWNQQSDYKAVHYNGRTYFSWVASNGDAKIATYVHATQTVEDEFTLHATLLDDLHVSPSILVRSSDHRLVVAYTRHDDSFIAVRISTNPEDTSAWGSEVTLDSTLGGEGYTYPSILQRDSGTILLFYRDYISATDESFLTYTSSTDGGATWAAQKHLYVEGTRGSYWKVFGRGERIDVVVIDGHPVTDAPTKMFHMWADETNWHDSDGTVLGSLPHDTSDMTEIYDGSDGSAWVMNVALDADDHPVVCYWTGTYGQTDMDINYAHWNGSAWELNLVTNTGGDGSTMYAPGGAVIDENDARYVYATVFDNGQLEAFKFTTEDDGATWSSRQLTAGSSTGNFWPAVVRNAEDGLRAIWLRGEDPIDNITSADFDLAIIGTSA
jgi:hypothetical protein